MSKYLKIIEDLEMALMNLKLAGADISSKINHSYVFKCTSGFLDFLSAMIGIQNKHLKQYFSLCLFLHKLEGLNGDTTCFIKFSSRGFILSISKSNFDLDVIPKSNIIDIIYFYDDLDSDDSFSCRLFNKRLKCVDDDDINKSYIHILKSFNDSYFSNLKSRDIFHLENQSVNEYIVNKLSKLDINYIDLDSFVEKFPYNNVSKGRDKLNSCFHLKKNILIKYISELYPIEIYRKICQIISLLEFRNLINSENKNDKFILEYYSSSKYKDSNLLITFIIIDIKICFFDDGTFNIYDLDLNSDVLVIDDLNACYQYLLNETFNKISYTSKIPLSELSFKDLELYFMVKI